MLCGRSRFRSLVMTLAVALAVFGHSIAAIAATYFFNGATDTWTGNNTFTSVESGSVTLVADDRVEAYNIYPNCSGPNRIRWSVSGITLTQRSGYTPFVADGGVNAAAISGNAWTSRGGGKWSIQLPQFTSALGGIQAVTRSYIGTQGTFWMGSNGGFLPKAADLAGCDATNMSWWLDTGASPPVLYVRDDAITTAQQAADEFDVVRGTSTIGTWSCVEVNGVNATVSSITVWRAGPRDASSYGIVMGNLGATVVGCIIQCSGYHGIGLNSGGTDLTSGTVRSCESHGLGYMGSSTNFVAYANNLVSGVVFERCTAYMHGLYKPDGTHLTPDAGTSYSGGMDGFYTHGNTTTVVRNYEVRDCAVYADISMMVPNGGPRPIYVRPYAVGQTSAVNGDPMDWRSYPARHVRCTAEGFGVFLFAPGAGTGTAMSFSQCTLRSGNHTAGNTWTDLSLSDSKGGIIGLGTNANNANILFSGCLITMTQQRAADTGYGVITLGDGASPSGNTLIFVRCTVLHTGNLSGRTGGEWLIVHRHDIEPTTARMIARDNIFAFTDVRSGAATYTGTATTALFRDAFSKMTTARAPLIYDFARNAYFIGTTSTNWANFTPTSNYNTAAKLGDIDPSDRGIDPRGIYGVSPAFRDGGAWQTAGVPAQAFMDTANVVVKTPGPMTAVLGTLRGWRGGAVGAVQFGPTILSDQIGGGAR